MPVKTAPQYNEIFDAPHYLPCVSLLMPFEPKMGLRKELSHKLKLAHDRIEKELEKNYPEDMVKLIIQKLAHLLSGINYFTHKKSLAIFISPLIEKIYYLDIAVEEKLIIDESFEIRDLIYSKKEIHKYLLVVLSSKWTKVYLGNTSHFARITLQVPDNINAYVNEMPEKVANFSDEQKRKEILLDKFLRHTDNALTLLLQTYRLPLFVMGTVRTVGHFKSLSHHTAQVIEYIHGNFEEHSEAELQKIMEPHVQNWKKIRQTELLVQLEEAMNHKKLAVGMDQVWRSSCQKKGRLLIVEKNYVYPAQHSANPEVIFARNEDLKNAFYIKDAVDDIIEKVLSSGGDVEFVDEGLLKAYEKIVLIEYFAGER